MAGIPTVDVTMIPSKFEVEAQFYSISLRVNDFKEPLTMAIKKVLIPSFRTNFRVGGRPAWQPLSPVTMKLRQTLHKGGYKYGGKILVNTGRLRRRATAMKIWTITDKSAEVTGLGPDRWYGELQQAGSTGIAHKIPARPFLVIQPEDELAIDEIFYTWIEAVVDEEGFHPG